MSEYQCYEFLALERPLTAKQMAAHDAEYLARLEWHCAMWKRVVDDPSHPDHAKKPVRRDGPRLDRTSRARAAAERSTSAAAGRDVDVKNLCRDPIRLESITGGETRDRVPACTWQA